MKRSVSYVLVALLALAALVLPPASQPAGADDQAGQAAQACSLASNGQTVVRDINGWQYLVHVPAGLPGPDAPLVVSLHGYMQTANGHESATRLSERADDFEFIVAYPRAAPWETPSSGWYWDGTNTTQKNFLRQVVTDIKSEWCVDSDRVYVDGYSNGGAMSQVMACEASNIFAAASSGGAVDMTWNPWGIPFPNCTPTNPIPIYLFCGELEDQRTGGCGADPTYDPLVRWAARNNCTSQQRQFNDPLGLQLRRQNCAGGVEVWYRELAGQNHWIQPPPAAVAKSVYTEIWVFYLLQQ